MSESALKIICHHVWHPYEYHYEQVNSKYEGQGQCLRLKSFICSYCATIKSALDKEINNAI